MMDHAEKSRVQALPGVNCRQCPGCLGWFDPVRATQVHCKPSCRVLALRRRRERRPDLFLACADAIDPAVFDN